MFISVPTPNPVRHAFRRARSVDGLANDEPPALQARMLAGGDYVAFNAGKQHEYKPFS